MASWKKIIVSGSNAELNHITSSGNFEITGNVSGSVTSTGSFGRVEATKIVGDGSGLTNLPAAAISSYTNSGNNRIITSVDSSTVNGESNLTFDGSTLGVTGNITSTSTIVADGNITSKGNIVAEGDVIANRYIVSSSVSIITSSFSSGSTIFGDSMDDIHQFTGSVSITGSTSISERLTATEIGAFTAAGAIDFNSQASTNVNIDTGDIASAVTINKSPVVNFNSGDVQGSITLSNLATGTGGLTIQAGSVEGTMFHSNVVDDSTLALSSNQLIIKNGGVTATQLATSVAGDGLDGGGGTALSVNLGGLSSVNIGASTSEVTIGDNLTVAGNLIVQGDTVQQQVANLAVEDRFILLNSGSASGDGGIVVQTESQDGDGVAFAYDDSESRWAFQQGTKLNASASAVAPDAYASAVVTSDDANYQKNGNIRVQGGEIYIYVE